MSPAVSTSAANEPATVASRRRRRRWLDLALGILLGIVLGLGVISAFVFLGSEGSIDAPRITGVDTGKPAQQTVPSGGGENSTPRPSQP